ncbi:hypothetical protein IEO21_10330 [Rhodonia placenta]|uniref:Uncharacterized protein n=1 Tax=Rhodonia placenta TaxID=104341 RepID=A0A8H7NSP9_9APHY|nr:hypothetical protein IEO21_10487 [Postia placenta]KAF9800556.1 hypothetical protein IEO21_10330 [Postia placenta]
MEPQTKKHS